MSQEIWQISPWGEESIFHPDYDNKQQPKSLSIRYISSTIVQSGVILKLEVNAANLKSGAAVVYIQHMGNKVGAYPMMNFKINKDGTTYIEFPLTGNDISSRLFNVYATQFTAHINCDGNNVQSQVFDPKIPNNTYDRKCPCACHRELTEEEVINMVIELRKNTTDQKNNLVYPVHKEKIFYETEGLSKDQQNNFKEYTRVLNTMFTKYNINTCIRKIHFLAQSYPETKYFTVTKEEGNNLKYDPYRGRGLMQLTGVEKSKDSGIWGPGIEDSRTKNTPSYSGYKKYSKIDVVSNPDLISNSLDLSADSAGWFWKFGKLKEDGSVIDLNNLADRDDIEGISELVNGGEKARKERRQALKALKKIFNYENCINHK